MKKNTLLLTLTIIFGLPWIATAQTYSGGTGTSADPYQISSAADWNSFATAVNGGNPYAGNYFKLTANIAISTMAGNSSDVFSGTFDGQGYALTVSISGTPASGSTPAVNAMAGLAPFGCISGATLKNLIVTGTVSQANGGCPHASGLVGYTFGGTTNTLENCVVHTNVSNTANSGNCHVGGIVGHAGTSTLTMRGCVYDGKITCTSASSAIGGLLGWSSDSKLTLNHCLFDGTIDRGSGPNYCIFHPIGCRDSRVPSGTVTNCYYTLTGTIADDNPSCVVSNTTGKGKFGYTITGASGAIVGRQGNPTNSYNVSEIDGYSVGIVYKGTPYAGNGESIPLSLSSPGFVVGGYTADHGTLSGSAHTGTNDPYTLAMQAFNTVISPKSPQQKFHIANTSTSTQMTWAEFAAAVNGGTTYSGQTVYLDEDISGVTQPMGTVIINSSGNYATGQSFFGTFEGGGHTITVNLASDTKGGNAPFRSIDGATIRNLVVQGTVNANSGGNPQVPNGNRHGAGLVGFVNTSCLVQNCLVKTNIGSGTDYIGGIIGHVRTSHATIIGCVYAGTITAARSTGETGQVGGLIGWSDAVTDAPTPQIRVENCFFVGNVNWINNPDHDDYDKEHFNPIACCNTSSTGSETHTYYTKDENDSPTTVFSNSGKHAYSITGAAHVVVARRDNPTTTYNVSKLDIYNPAIVYDGTLYAGNTEVVPLSLGCPGFSFAGYTADHGTLSGSAITGNNDPYTLTMQAYNTVISLTNPQQKFHIANTQTATQMTWAEFTAAVSAGTNYNGQTVYVDEDIPATTVAGTSEKPFQGLFEGNGHTVNFTCSSNVADKGLIGYVSGTGAIQNVIVNASLSGTSTSVGTVVGTFASTGTISNVEGAGTINCAATNIGGLVGDLRSGTLHSSFAVATLDGSATNMGGLVGINGGNLYNSYSNASYGGSANNKGGLVGVNNSGKNVKNCYAAGIASGVSALAGSNSGIIQYCYADALGDGYVGTNTSAPTGCGLYGAVQSSNKHLDYMYRDNLITKNTNTYVGSNDAIEDGISVYVKKHIPVWNGLVSALNQWVRANPEGLNGLSPWYRPLTTSINGDLPVLGFDMGNSLATTDGKQLQYSASLDRLLYDHASHTAYVFLYGNATNITQTPGANVHVFVHEDAVLLQTTTEPGDFINTTVGITFDNSDHGQHAYDFWGNKLNYDWHLLSTPLRGLKTGAVHNSYAPSGNTYSPVDITDIGGYFPDGLITNDNPAVGGTIKWDFYTYYEPQYHWINLKRNKNNHYHMDGGSSIEYNEPDQDEGDNTAYYIPGKGYEMAISQDTYMNATGTLNKGNVSISLTNAEPDDILYAKGWNLVGNPYQGYLDLSQITNAYPELDKFYIYDADQGVFAPVVDGSSSNPVIPSKYIHPHQAFFVLAPSHNFNLTFQPTWAGTTTSADGHSYFRDNAEEPHYPLVNLFAEDETGHRDLTVIEFHRPELGGAGKLDYMRTSPFSLAAHYDGTSYGILFATDDIVRIPVRFKADGDGLITLRWSTHNGDFRKLILIDNKLGVEHDMLATDSYTFAASPTDYSSRFYITYDCSGTGIGGDGQETESESFAYHSNGQIVIKTDTRDASLQVVDMMGRVLVNKDALNATTTFSTNGLARGIYILRLSNRHQVKTQKIVVQ